MNVAYCRKYSGYRLALGFNEIPGSGVSVLSLLFIAYHFTCAPMGHFLFL